HLASVVGEFHRLAVDIRPLNLRRGLANPEVVQLEKHPFGLLAHRPEVLGQRSRITELLDRAIETLFGLETELLRIEGADAIDRGRPEAIENVSKEHATDRVVEIARRRGELDIVAAQTEAAERPHLGILAALDRGAEKRLDAWALGRIEPGDTADRQD